METKKEKIDEKLEKILYSDIEGKFMHIKVGNKESNTIGPDIKEIEDKIVNLFSINDINCVVLVTGYDVEIKLIERSN